MDKILIKQFTCTIKPFILIKMVTKINAHVIQKFYWASQESLPISNTSHHYHHLKKWLQMA